MKPAVPLSPTSLFLHFALSHFRVLRKKGAGVAGQLRMWQIIAATTNDQVKEARRLFQEYAAATGLDLEFQGFAAELAGLPGDYAPPRGRLLLAWEDDRAIGVVAVRPLQGDIGELKRLYVAPAGRGQGVGRALVQAAIEAAREIGYSRLRLDTLPTMPEAIALYESLGFRPIAPYRHNPVPGAVFLELALSGFCGSKSPA